MRYLELPFHAALKEHYFEGQYRARHLAIDPDWCDAHLPRSPKTGESHNNLVVTYLDLFDGKTYDHAIYVAWEDFDDVWFQGFDENWNALNAGRKVRALMPYFYGQHHCPCHRKQDASDAGAVTDDECEGSRFQIVKIVAPSHSDLILYSETMDVEELERTLNTRPEPVS